MRWNVPNRACGLGRGLFARDADIPQKGIIQQCQCSALPPNGKGIQQHADKAIRGKRRAGQVSGEVHGGLSSFEKLMEYRILIIMLDAIAIFVLI
jgi:hypothetical protein